MEDLSLHILDVAENSINAGADLITITVIENLAQDILQIDIEDNGKGIPPEKIDYASDPFFTTRTTRRVGLGLPLLKQSAEEAGGSLVLSSEENIGTSISATFTHSHIDRKPLGNITMTILVLITGNPDIDFVFNYSKDKIAYSLDTRPIRKELENVPLNAPEVVAAIREELETAMKKLIIG